MRLQEVQTMEGEILKAFAREPGISQSQLAEMLKVNLNTVKYHVRKLQEKGFLERVGTSRKGYWIVKEGC